VSERGLQLALAFIGGINLVIGLSALVAPGWFFDEIGHYGARNTHYAGDVGAFYAAAGAVTLASIRLRSWRVPLLWLTAVWYGLHAVNHAFDTGEAESNARGISDTVLLALGAGLSAYLARVAGRLAR
jgi:hypothetical protein